MLACFTSLAEYFRKVKKLKLFTEFRGKKRERNVAFEKVTQIE